MFEEAISDSDSIVHFSGIEDVVNVMVVMPSVAYLGYGSGDDMPTLKGPCEWVFEH